MTRVPLGEGRRFWNSLFSISLIVGENLRGNVGSFAGEDLRLEVPTEEELEILRLADEELENVRLTEEGLELELAVSTKEKPLLVDRCRLVGWGVARLKSSGAPGIARPSASSALRFLLAALLSGSRRSGRTT